MKIPIAKPHIDEKDKAGVMETLNSGYLSMGKKYIQFEQAMNAYTHSKYAMAVSNGTCGLHLAVKALGLKKGDEVITSPFSFISSSNCLLFEGVKPVFVDVEETTFNLDPNLIERAITSKTKAILVVHIFGQSAEMKPILKLAKKYNLKIIEDACESLGSNYYNKATGTMGDIGVYAFYPNKQMTTGEGGMMVTNSKKLADLCKSLRNQGRGKQGDWLIHERLGYNYRMDEMSASLGVTQLKKLDWMIKEKAKVVNWYQQMLADLEQQKKVQLPKTGPNRTHSWFVYAIRIKKNKRNKLMNHLADKGIQTKPYLPVIHLQPFMKERFNYKKGDYPVAEKIAAQSLALPLYIGLKKSEVKYIIDQITNFL